jgi:hypothetical protein
LIAPALPDAGNAVLSVMAKAFIPGKFLATAGEVIE